MRRESAKKKVRYRFEVKYQTKKLKQIQDFMDKLDLGNQIFLFTETIEFLGDDKPITYYKDLIKQAYESIEAICLEIIGGKIE